MDIRYSKNLVEYVAPDRDRSYTQAARMMYELVFALQRGLIGAEFCQRNIVLGGYAAEIFVHYGDGLPVAAKLRYIEGTYYVQSRKIAKVRGKTRDEAHTKDLAKAVKLAKQYAVPWTAEEYMGHMRGSHLSEVRGYVYRVHLDNREAMNTAFGDRLTSMTKGAQAAMQMLRGSDYEGVDTKTRLELEKGFEAADNVTRSNAETVELCTVVVTYPDDPTKRRYTVRVAGVDGSTMYDDTSLPEAYKRKMAVLSLCEDNTTIAGVGSIRAGNSFLLFEGEQ